MPSFYFLFRARLRVYVIYIPALVRVCGFFASFSLLRDLFDSYRELLFLFIVVMIMGTIIFLPYYYLSTLFS